MNKFIRQSASSNHQDSEHWMSVSDLMSGLMMVFLFISIAMMRSAFIERDKIKEVAVAYQEKQVAIYEQLMLEFKDDLVRWDADIDKQSLAFRFNSPDILFATGEATLTPTFQSILQEFFPRFLKVLNQFHNVIEEIKIEGHTSSKWEGVTKDIAYFKNMDLSQARTNSVLKYVYSIEKNKSTREWIRNNIAAVGYSSSRLVFTDKGNEDSKRSRRVTFRVLTNAEIQIRKILGD
jgi:outer membrane protein OmpA-like peptidoglycan-associated protein